MIEKAIALGIKAAAAHSPTSDADYVRVYGGKYLVDRKWPCVDRKWPRVDPKWPQYASRSGRALHAPR